MTTYLITNRIACTILGIFEAASEDDAVAAMIRDAGYRDAVHEAEVLESTVEKLRDELVVTEVDVPAAITALAHEMVRCYRVCGDDLSAADMIDDNAHHADDWDHVGVGACGVTAGLRPSLVEALWQQYRDDLRDAYVAAWRAAVTLDLAATVKEIAEAMVVLDRDSSDCDAVRDDAAAGDAAHWDTDGIVAAAEAAGIDGAVAAAIAWGYLSCVGDAYAAAWRAAVELDLAARDDA